MPGRLQLQGLDQGGGVHSFHLELPHHLKTGEKFKETGAGRVQAADVKLAVTIECNWAWLASHGPVDDLDLRKVGDTSLKGLGQLWVGLDQQQARRLRGEIVVQFAAATCAQMDDGVHGCVGLRARIVSVCLHLCLLLVCSGR